MLKTKSPCASETIAYFIFKHHYRNFSHVTSVSCVVCEFVFVGELTRLRLGSSASCPVCESPCVRVAFSASWLSASWVVCELSSNPLRNRKNCMELIEKIHANTLHLVKRS